MRRFVLALIVSLLLVSVIGIDIADACRRYYDFSDAPGYGTAYHKMRSRSSSYQWFGTNVDSERSVGHDPEDNGFTFSSFVLGEPAWVTYTAHTLRRRGAREYINAWIDWNQDKVFQSSENIIHEIWRVGSSKTRTGTVHFTVPNDALLGAIWLRARINCSSFASPTGYRNQGEVEDYETEVVPEPASMILLGSLATGLFGMAGLRRRFRR